MSQNLLLHYERKLYVLVDTPENRRLIGQYVEVFQYPYGRIEIRVAGAACSLDGSPVIVGMDVPSWPRQNLFS